MRVNAFIALTIFNFNALSANYQTNGSGEPYFPFDLGAGTPVIVGP
jgi:hypothetical protein